MSTLEIPDTFTALTIPVPPSPILENALGYRQHARWFATWWEPGGDEAMVSDGHIAMTGSWEGFLTFTKPFYKQLEVFELGNSDVPAKHWLMIDREARKAYAAPAREAGRFLRAQWPKTNVTHITEEQWREIVEKLQEQLRIVKPPTAREMAAAYQAHMDAQATLQAWLNVWFNRN
jgi:hypothetical protein